jgi:YD repeat-containing protein
MPLVVERTHLSSYRAGRWFGRSWASTLDQCVEVDDDGVCFASADGMLLVYPTPTDGMSVLPEEGPRWPLTVTADGGYTIVNAETGHTLHFAPGSSATLPLTTIVDRNGHRIDFDHNAEGVLTEVRHSGGYRIAVDTAGGRITALRLLDANNNADNGSGNGVENGAVNGGDVTLMRYGYDVDGNLSEVINSSDLPMRFDYDSDGRILRWEDRRGCWYEFSYDEAGRCVSGVWAACREIWP